jgi:hypothetical protein
MIFSHIPAQYHIVDFPLGGKGDKYLVVDPDCKRVCIMERGTENRVQGYREIAEVNETNIYMLAPAWQTYVRLWWEKWGV